MDSELAFFRGVCRLLRALRSSESAGNKVCYDLSNKTQRGIDYFFIFPSFEFLFSFLLSYEEIMLRILLENEEREQKVL